MFDVSWSELLILAIVALIFVGPKELPRLLNTLGRYAGVVRRHANEFRSYFEQAMREAELEVDEEGGRGHERRHGALGARDRARGEGRG